MSKVGQDHKGEIYRDSWWELTNSRPTAVESAQDLSPLNVGNSCVAWSV